MQFVRAWKGPLEPSSLSDTHIWLTRMVCPSERGVGVGLDWRTCAVSGDAQRSRWKRFVGTEGDVAMDGSDKLRCSGGCQNANSGNEDVLMCRVCRAGDGLHAGLAWSMYN